MKPVWLPYTGCRTSPRSAAVPAAVRVERIMKITNQKGPVIPKEFIGLFLEDINYAIDGGLYAEMLENRSFESLDVYGGDDKDYYVKYDGLYAWETDSPGLSLEIVQGSPVSRRNPHYLRAACRQEGGRFWNKAYEGIYMRPSVPYHVSFYARCAHYQGDLRVSVIQEDGSVAAEKSVVLRPAGETGWNRWERYELALCSDREVCGGRFTICIQRAGVVEFDWFSMVPEDAVLGVFRRDLAERLKELRPGFLRFPGGCVAEGATLANRYRFQDTLGPVEDRLYNWNRWALEGNSRENGWHSCRSHYGQTCGIGFYEYFLLSEYLGAKPLPVLGVGLACQYQSHERIEPDDDRIWEYIQDYLDLIEFANGGPETRWGAVRCRMGHPEPFGLEMIGVGNEQWECAESRFFERYTLFEREIHKVYPAVKLIGTSGPELDSPRFQAAWQFYRTDRSQDHFVYAVDEHYYTSPDWFLSHCGYFDDTPRNPKVVFGEYAAHPNMLVSAKGPERNTLEGALAEAAFLTGMARNSDLVVMTCYAPLLARIGYAQWSPNLLWFDGKSVCRTPSYFVQQMFSENLGDCNIGLLDCELPCQASCDTQRGELVLMLVNPHAQARRIPLQTAGGKQIAAGQAEGIILAGDALSDRNSLGNEMVRPVRRQIPLTAGYEAPPFSFTVLRIPLA